jgi:uncharacterized ion transporter superfamily protein YfcC
MLQWQSVGIPVGIECRELGNHQTWAEFRQRLGTVVGTELTCSLARCLIILHFSVLSDQISYYLSRIALYPGIWPAK